MTKQTKQTKRNISGVLLLDKPIGLTSNQALQICKHIYNASKAGHTGTLDPLATGLLPICFGEATKFSSALLCADKTYNATIKLGYSSSTGDSDGEISAVGKVNNLTLKKVKCMLQGLTGKTTQTPPMHSAMKHCGKPLYTYARKGIKIERKPREITIYDLQVTALNGDELNIIVQCSAGTYIRTLAEDLGKILGCGGAYVTSLNRTAIGALSQSNSYTLDILKNMSSVQCHNCLKQTDTLLYNLPAIYINKMDSKRLLHGQIVNNQSLMNKFQEKEEIRLYDKNKQFLGLGIISASGAIIPKRLMAIPSIQNSSESL